jgi:hypothetical protein
MVPYSSVEDLLMNTNKFCTEENGLDYQPRPSTKYWDY